VAWFGDTARVLLAALDADPAASAWTFFPPHTVGFWQRRRCLEGLVHRWDAQHALGIDGVLDPVLAGDGIAEVIEVMAPRQVDRGRAAAPSHAILLAAADVSSSWILGPGQPVATISGTAADLLLLLWGRLPAGDRALTWAGDRPKALAVLNGRLVP
jgi:uncharacterized protein (TIGR03083 family)